MVNLLLRRVKIIGQTTWIYNQDVITSGLANPGVATKDPSLFDQIEITLGAAIAHLTVNGTWKSLVMMPRRLGTDQQMFKKFFT